MTDRPPHDPRRRRPPPPRGYEAQPPRRQEPPPVARRRSGEPPRWGDQHRPPQAWSDSPPPRREQQRYREPQPHREPPRRQAPPPQEPPPKQRKKKHWGRRISLTLVVLLVLIVGAGVWADTSLTRVDALGNYEGRPADTPGTNWLLVGSDSRTGLSPEQEATLATGGEVGNGRTDTILLIHVPKSGPTTMVSLPRDWYVPIPGNGTDKLNSSFAIGGAALTVQTVETVTGVRIDHYAEIGFGGFAGMVDSIGGVDVCVPYDINDPLAGLNVTAGCQSLDGPQALGFVRSRATALADIDRMNNQRLFLTSLLSKATSPSTFLNPFRLWPLVGDAVDSLKVDNGDHLWNLASLAFALRGDIVTTSIPISGFEDVDGSGNVLLSDRDRASQMFDLLARDQQIPIELRTGG